MCRGAATVTIWYFGSGRELSKFSTPDKVIWSQNTPVTFLCPKEAALGMNGFHSTGPLARKTLMAANMWVFNRMS